MPHRVVPEEIGQQDQQLGAARQPGQPALVRRVPSADVMRHAHAHGGERLGDFPGAVGTHHYGI